MIEPTCHTPVLLDAILASGNPRPQQVWVDGTAGGGGHSTAILERIGTTGKLLALDRDPVAVQRLKVLFDQPVNTSLLPEGMSNSTSLLPEGMLCRVERLTGLLDQRNVAVRQDSYESIPELLRELAWGHAHGIVLDLGLSSDQLADRDRGFSFSVDGPLDMRFDPTQGQPVSQWLNWANERDIADTIYCYGEERFSRRIARRIVERRKHEPIRSTQQLRELVGRCVPTSRHNRIDPATRTFQALRIQVNDELGSLQRALRRLPDCLHAGGLLFVISFHSLEDRIVKHAFRDDPRLAVVSRKPIVASEAELAVNYRARSAKLRIACRV